MINKIISVLIALLFSVSTASFVVNAESSNEWNSVYIGASENDNYNVLQHADAIKQVLEQSAPELEAFITILDSKGNPVIIHCDSSGKLTYSF